MPHKRAKRSVRLERSNEAGFNNPPESSAKVVTKKGKKPTQTDSFGGRTDLDGLSKNAFRVVNASTIREEYNQRRKRKREEEEDSRGLAANKKLIQSLKPLPYESLSKFNHRVEASLRSTINSTIQASKSTSQKRTKKSQKNSSEEQEQLQSEEPELSKTELKALEKKKINGSIDPFAKPKKGETSEKEPIKPVRERATSFLPAQQTRSLSEIVDAPLSLTSLKLRKGSTAPSIHAPIPKGRIPVSDEMKKLMDAEREKAVKAYRQLKEKNQA